MATTFTVPKAKLRILAGFSMIAALIAFFSLSYPAVQKADQPTVEYAETTKTKPAKKKEVSEHSIHINRVDLRPTFRLAVFLLMTLSLFLLLWRGALLLTAVMELLTFGTYVLWFIQTLYQLYESETAGLTIKNLIVNLGNLFDYLSFFAVLALLVWHTSLISRMLRKGRTEQLS
ncbi:MAG: hypothetical protein HKN25_07835 [Pyrinomonadaceae bacterium]|nr:hypothetical protein [Pyrinomonadaceae bacterium]